MANVGSIYSNFDHELNEQLVETMEVGDTGEHDAWEFFGTIARTDTGWRETVERYRIVVGKYENADLKALIREVNDNHGWD